MMWDFDAPEVLGYYWHRDTKNNIKERIVEIVRDQGTNAIIVFDPRKPLETKSAYTYGGEWAGPLEVPTEVKK